MTPGQTIISVMFFATAVWTVICLHQPESTFSASWLVGIEMIFVLVILCQQPPFS